MSDLCYQSNDIFAISSIIIFFALLEFSVLYSQESEESEEDDSTTEEQRKARQYRKRKAAPGWANKKYETVGLLVDYLIVTSC